MTTAKPETFAQIQQRLVAEVPVPEKGKQAPYDFPLEPPSKVERRRKPRPPSDRQPVVMIGYAPANDHPAPARQASRTRKRPTAPDSEIYTTGHWGPSGLHIGRRCA